MLTIRQHKPPPQGALIHYYNFNHVPYVINKNGDVGVLLKKYPIKIKYLDGQINTENPNNIYTVNDFENQNKILYEDYIRDELKKNKMIYDYIYYDTDLLEKEYSLGDFRKYKELIIDVTIKYILIKKIRNITSIYAIGDFETENEKFRDVGLGFLTYQDSSVGGILTNLYPGVLPKGWGSALLCLISRITGHTSIKLEALTKEAKAFYLRLGFIENKDGKNNLDLVLGSIKILNTYCLEKSINLDSFSYDVLLENGELIYDINLSQVVDIL